MLESLQGEVGSEHKQLNERIRDLEHRLASKELEQKQVGHSEPIEGVYFATKTTAQKIDMIKRLEGVAAKQQKMLNQSDRKIAKLESKLKASKVSEILLSNPTHQIKKLTFR